MPCSTNASAPDDSMMSTNERWASLAEADTMCGSAVACVMVWSSTCHTVMSASNNEARRASRPALFSTNRFTCRSNCDVHARTGPRAREASPSIRTHTASAVRKPAPSANDSFVPSGSDARARCSRTSDRNLIESNRERRSRSAEFTSVIVSTDGGL